MVSAETVTLGAIGSLFSGRAYDTQAPAKAVRPYAVFQAVTGEEVNDLDGTDGPQNAHMQIAVWADSRMDARAAIRAVRLAMKGVAGGVPLSAATAVFEPETGLFGFRQDFSIWFIETE